MKKYIRLSIIDLKVNLKVDLGIIYFIMHGKQHQRKVIYHLQKRKNFTRLLIIKLITLEVKIVNKAIKTKDKMPTTPLTLKTIISLTKKYKIADNNLLM